MLVAYIGDEIAGLPVPAETITFIDNLLVECKSIYKALGPGFMEATYHNALIKKLYDGQVRFQSEPMLPILFEGSCCGYVAPDFIFPEKQLVLELKAMARRPSHGEKCQLHAQLRTSGYPLGILVNFRQIIGTDDIDVDVVSL